MSDPAERESAAADMAAMAAASGNTVVTLISPNSKSPSLGLTGLSHQDPLVDQALKALASSSSADLEKLLADHPDLISQPIPRDDNIFSNAPQFRFFTDKDQANQGQGWTTLYLYGSASINTTKLLGDPLRVSHTHLFSRF